MSLEEYFSANNKLIFGPGLDVTLSKEPMLNLVQNNFAMYHNGVPFSRVENGQSILHLVEKWIAQVSLEMCDAHPGSISSQFIRIENGHSVQNLLFVYYTHTAKDPRISATKLENFLLEYCSVTLVDNTQKKCPDSSLFVSLYVFELRDSLDPEILSHIMNAFRRA